MNKYIFTIILFLSAVAYSADHHDTVKVFHNDGDGEANFNNVIVGLNNNTSIIGRVSIDTRGGLAVEFIPDLPDTADIVRAVIRIRRATTAGTTTPDVYILHEVGDASILVDEEDLDNRSWGDDSAAWTLPVSADEDWVESPDISALITAWISGDGYDDEDTLCLYIKNFETSNSYYAYFCQRDSSTDYAPQLYIFWGDQAYTRDTIKSSDSIKDGFVGSSSATYNFGGNVNFYLPTSISIYQYIYVELPVYGDITSAEIKIRLWHSEGAGTNTGYIYPCTRPHVKDYVGNNTTGAADSAEMNWNNFFEGGSGDDTAWTRTGFDIDTTDTIGTYSSETSTAQWAEVTLSNDASVDLLNGDRDNYGFVFYAKTGSFNHIFHSMEADSTPYVCIAYVQEEASTKKRIILIE